MVSGVVWWVVGDDEVGEGGTGVEGAVALKF